MDVVQITEAQTYEAVERVSVALNGGLSERSL